MFIQVQWTNVDAEAVCCFSANCGHCS